MVFLKLTIGVLFLTLGVIFLYQPNLMLRMNQLARELLFNDKRLLLERKRLAIFFFALSFVALYMGFTSLNHWMAAKKKFSVDEGSKYLMYLAMQDFCTEKYDRALQRYSQILQTDPRNTDALKYMALVYDELGDSKRARVTRQRILAIDPEDKETMSRLGKIRK
ncbi:MAG: tetratricopeptide repeat protein [Endomicrobiales bacterium]|nr:tetratricopeptide repeat protein [Endomicrobiales bacterium]